MPHTRITFKHKHNKQQKEQLSQRTTLPKLAQAIWCLSVFILFLPGGMGVGLAEEMYEVADADDHSRRYLAQKKVNQHHQISDKTDMFFYQD